MHERRWARSITLFVLFASATLGLPGTPASAADPADLRVDLKTRDITFMAGGPGQTVTFTVTNQGPGPVTPITTFTVPFTGAGVKPTAANIRCIPDGAIVTCELSTLGPGEGRDVSIDLAPPAAGTVPSPSTEKAPVTVTANGDPAQAPPDPDTANNRAEINATLQPDIKLVPEISGTVTDSAGAAVADAEVRIKDEAGKEATIKTDSAGLFVYRSPGGSDPNALRAGKLAFTAHKDNYRDATTTAEADDTPLTGVSLAFPAAPSKSPPATLRSTVDETEDAYTNLTVPRGAWLTLAIVTGAILLAVLLTAIWLAHRAHQEKHFGKRPHA